MPDPADSSPADFLQSTETVDKAYLFSGFLSSREKESLIAYPQTNTLELTLLVDPLHYLVYVPPTHTLFESGTGFTSLVLKIRQLFEDSTQLQKTAPLQAHPEGLLKVLSWLKMSKSF